MLCGELMVLVAKLSLRITTKILLADDSLLSALFLPTTTKNQAQSSRRKNKVKGTPPGGFRKHEPHYKSHREIQSPIPQQSTLSTLSTLLLLY
jgi:hypothetical protein